MLKKVACVLLIAIMVLSFAYSNAEGSFVYDLTKDGAPWAGENASLDSFKFDEQEQAYAGDLYNANWADRFGGVSIQVKDQEVKISATKNRFLKIMVRVDDLGSQNAFDKFAAIYWLKGDGSPKYASVPADGIKSLNGTTEYKTFIFDLNWGEEEKTIERFRMDMFTSSIDKAAVNTDGSSCGKMYIKYIAFFDTREDAENYDPFTPEPTTEPTTEPETEPSPETGVPVAIFAQIASVSMAGVLIKRRRKSN